MHINTAIKNVKKLTDFQIQHYIQLMNVEMENYIIVCRNYSVEQMDKYGRPFMKKLEEKRNVFIGEMNERRDKQDSKIS